MARGTSQKKSDTPENHSLSASIGEMRTGEIEANLVTLNEEFRLPYIAFHESEYQRLRVELQAAHDVSKLPELPSDETRAALNDLLVRMRLKLFRN